ncbi:hypothetical protein [Priestia megaterium]|uniref:hypothetical protein n=1 Tax=Priestia megaterium TaxID=1404 RepID=UPI003AF32DAF
MKSFRTDKSFLLRIEAMHIIKKGQLALQGKHIQNQVKFIHQIHAPYKVIEALDAISVN